MLNSICSLWALIRRTICPTRIYQHGTNGLAYFDDRMPLEKICDFVSNRLFYQLQAQRYSRHNLTRWNINDWVDKLGNSRKKVLELEKKGYAYMSPREFDQIASNAKTRLAKEEKDRLRKKVQFAVSEIKKGRRYSQEYGKTLERLKKNG